MNLKVEDNRRRIIAGASMTGLAILILIELAFFLNGSFGTLAHIFVYGLMALLTIFSALGIAHLLRQKADWCGLIGTAFVLIGLLMSGRMAVIFQMRRILEEGVEAVPADAVESIFNAHPELFMSIFPLGLFAPLGIITLGIGLVAARKVRWWMSALLILSGILFPIGRAAQVIPAYIACDIVAALTFALLGWQVLSRPEIWMPLLAENPEPLGS